jgi:dethiobiotin synthetase
VSARMHRRRIRLDGVIRHIRQAGAAYEYIIIEGSGGVLVPLGPNFDVRDLILELDCEVIMVSQNRLGTINHTLLTLEALTAHGCETIGIALMELGKGDFSARTNLDVLRELCSPISVLSMPYVGARALAPQECDKLAKKLKKTLASILH